jgi:hypothetical protein
MRGVAELACNGKNGLFSAPGAADSLARQLQRLLDDAHLLSALRAGIDPVKTSAQEMDKLEHICSQATERKSQISSPESPWVTIIVLNWNGLADTLECLESLAGLDYPTYEVVVVDNGSSDGVGPVVRQRFPTMTVLENGENLGYAGGEQRRSEVCVVAGGGLYVTAEQRKLPPISCAGWWM